MSGGEPTVNGATGELIAALTPDEARTLTDRITTALSVSWELIVQAYTERAWAALGYSTWDAYTAAEFGKIRLRLPSEDRQEIVASMRDAGLSTRAIAAAVGVSDGTVRNDIKAGAQNYAPHPRPSVDPAPSSAERPDGDQETESEGPAPAPSDSAPANDEGDTDVDVIDALHKAAENERTITGTDGKTYKATNQSAERIARAKLLAADGHTANEIATKLGMTYEACISLMNRYGVEVTSGKTRAAIAARVAKAKDLASTGHTSRQIAEAIGVAFDSFSGFKARHGIEVPADAVVGRTAHHDSARIVGEIASSLEGLVMTVDLVDLDALDPAQTNDWANSIKSSLTALTRFNKQLKEMTQ